MRWGYVEWGSLSTPHRLQYQYIFKPKPSIFTNNMKALLLSYLFALVCAATTPDFYPSPPIGTVKSDWSTALDQSLRLVSQMTIPEKVNITTGQGWLANSCVGSTGGVPRLGLRGLCMQDGPLGVRFTDFVNVFPCGGAMASTFDRSLVHQRGNAIGRQSRKKGVDVHLGPCVGPIGRHATGGRNWEGFSPDSYLTGKLAFEAVQGVQEEHVLATIKHLVGNEQDHYRRQQEWQEGYNFTNLQQSISSNIDDRALHEVYLWPFADAVKAGVGAVMCSYNYVNGTQACQNSDLLNGKLKSELGFQGFVMSDWFAQMSGVSNALAGMDMSMPGTDVDEKATVFWGQELTKMVVNGTLPESRLDDMVVRILTPLIHFGVDDREPNFSSWNMDTVGIPYPAAKQPDKLAQKILNYHYDVRDQFTANVALEGARGAIVLLKNNGILPLKHKRNIGVFGLGSRMGPKGAVCGDNMQCSDGALIEGWGSGTSYPTEYVSPYEALHKKAALRDYHVTGTTESWDMTLPLQLASGTDVNIVYVLSNSGESTASVDTNIGDRNNVSLWHNGDSLITNIASRGPAVVVVTTVGQVDMSAWVDHANVTAILYTAPGGDFGGEALAEVIFGEINPSGKLAYTIASDVSDYIPIVRDIPEDGKPQSDFTEGVYIDYKWFDKYQKPVQYEFGYGMSYSNYTFTGLRVNVNDVSEFLPKKPDLLKVSKPDDYKTQDEDLYTPKDFDIVEGLVYPWITNTDSSGSDFTFANGEGQVSDASGGVGGHPWLWTTVGRISHTTTNCGHVSGRVVSQLYLSFPETLVDSPPVQLRGFDKSRDLRPGQSQHTEYKLNWRDLAIWDVSLQSWRVQRGEYKVFVGHSSRDMELTGSFTL